MNDVFPDTIVALSSGRLPSGVAIVRVSGRHARFALETIFGKVPDPRHAAFGTLRTVDGEPIDSGLILFFPSPHSFTGEDCVEFQVHGSRAVVSSLLQTLTSLPSIRHAEAGEFTRRAFLNGRLDLTETEALADLIASETEAQRRLAVMNADGAQSKLYSKWREQLIHARAMIEAELDFADESDVPGSVSDQVWADMRSLRAEIEEHISAYHRAEIIRDGYDVVILGAPNSGKSSLLNILARREAAIVSDEPGTTRDLVELSLDLNGIKIRLTDTAGIRAEAGKVEAIGIERAIQRARTADLVLLLSDITDISSPVPVIDAVETVRIGTKIDLNPRYGAGHTPNLTAEDSPTLLVSSVSGAGISTLLELLSSRARQAAGRIGDILPSRLRHVELLRETAEFLALALEDQDDDVELRAENLRIAADRLGRISGAVDVEDLLDVIFSQFCIGK